MDEQIFGGCGDDAGEAYRDITVRVFNIRVDVDKETNCGTWSATLHITDEPIEADAEREEYRGTVDHGLLCMADGEYNALALATVRHILSASRGWVR